MQRIPSTDDLLVMQYNHVHGSHGYFASSYDAGTGPLKNTRVRAAHNAGYKSLRKPDGGFSVDMHGREYTTGYSVSMKDHTASFPARNLKHRFLADHAETHSIPLKQHGNFQGGWHDPATGLIHLDVSRNFGAEDDANAFGVLHHQISYYDHAQGKSTYVRYPRHIQPPIGHPEHDSWSG